MFARYEYKAGTTLANLIADVAAILTGTTDKATLSADCVQATTEIISTVPAGWLMHDAAAGTNKICLKAPNIDGILTKYAILDFNISANNIYAQAVETWNATTHVGTNASYNPSAYAPISVTAGGTLFISASERYFVIVPVSYTLVWGIQVGVFEHSRLDPWNTPTLGYPAHIAFDASSMANVNINSLSYMAWGCRYKDSGVDRTGGQAGLFYTFENLVPQGYMSSVLSNLWDVNMSLYHAVYPIKVVALAGRNSRVVGMLGGILYGVYATTSSFGVNGDELMVGSDTYFIFKAQGAVSLAVLKK